MPHFLALASMLGLGGCSYAFDIEAVTINGQIAFKADAPWPNRPDCVTRIEVMPETYAPVAEGEDVDAWSERTYAWKDDGGYDCQDRFPVFYGRPLKGQDIEEVGPDIDPKALQPGVIYRVHITAGATGYGGGRFRLLPDGRVENLRLDEDLF